MIGPLIKSMILKICPLGAIYVCSYFNNISILRNLSLIFKLEKKKQNIESRYSIIVDKLCIDVLCKLLQN